MRRVYAAHFAKMAAIGDTKVGVVGAGIAGCSAAALIRDISPDASIQVYERTAEVGGRIRTTNFHGSLIELGASFFHSSNRALVSLLNTLGFEVVERQRLHGQDMRSVGIWNGEKFVTTLPTTKVASAITLLARYGPDVIRMRTLASQMLAKWKQVYEVQDSERIFESPKDMLKVLGFAPVLLTATHITLSHPMESATV